MNNLLTDRMIILEFLRLLTGNLVFKELVDSRFQNEFRGKVGDTISIRRHQPIHSKYYDGNQIHVQNITESPVDVKLNRWRDTSIAISSYDRTLKLQDYSKQILEPIVVGLAQDIDSDIAAALVGYASHNIAKTANPTNLADIANLGRYLDNKKALQQDRHLVFSVNHKYDYALTENLSKVAYAGDNRALRDAILGKLYTFMTYMSQNMPKSTALTAGTATSYKISGTAGNDTVAITELNSATATVKAGEGFIVDGQMYKFVADGTGSSSAIASIKIDRPLHASFATATEVKVVNKEYSVAFQRDALAFVTVPLEQPEGAAKSFVETLDGISVRVVVGYDMDKKTDVMSFDFLYGIAPLNTDLIVTLS